MSLIPPKKALAISKSGKSASFAEFKKVFTELYNRNVRMPGFKFPMNITRWEIKVRNQVLGDALSVAQMETMIRTIMAEYDNDPSIKVTVSTASDHPRDNHEWVVIDVKEVNNLEEDRGKL
jgi:hypothetical protein